MLKYTLLSLLFSLKISCAISQSTPNPTKAYEGAAIEFEKTIQDFWGITEGEKFMTSYPFKNTGTEVLIIQNIKGSCKCVTATASSKEVYPGESATIDVIYDSTDKGAEQGRAESKRITITANTDPQNSYLTIKGKVYSDRHKIDQNSTAIAKANEGAAIEFEETVKDFGEITEGERVETSYRFKNIGTEVLIIEKIKGSCKCTTGTSSSKEVNPGESATIEVIYDSTNKGAEHGRAEAKRLTITANTDPQNSYLTIKGKVYTAKSIVESAAKSDIKTEVSFDENGKKSGEERVYKTNGTIDQINNYINGQLHGVSQSFDENGVIINELTYTQGKIDSDKLNSKSDLKFVGEWRIDETFTREAYLLFNNLGYAYMSLDDNLDTSKLMGGKMFNYHGVKCRMEFQVTDSVNPHHLDIKITQLESGEEFNLLILASFIDDDTLKIAYGKSPVVRATEFTKENTEIFRRKKFN